MLTRNPVLLTMAAIIGVISPSGNEIGPFLSIEQAALTQLLPGPEAHAGLRLVQPGWLIRHGDRRADGRLAGASAASERDAGARVVPGGTGGLCPGRSGADRLLSEPVTGSRGQHASDQQHATPAGPAPISRNVVLKLSALFALDAFAGGLIVQSMMAYWFHVRFGVDTGIIGSIFFGANILAGISALLAARLAAKIGLINTMVFTHIPSNILLILVPLMPTLPLAITVLLLRFSISQMDVPTRQSYTMAVVAPDERSAASGVTSIARSVGAAISPSLTGIFLGIPALISAPFFLSGGLKIVYDLLLYRSFRSIKPPEEK